ncbi:uncharacterized protein [Palaemon carinicauda]|uniref:uncharacterized protein n=1 Tax=Palaemon carinicauda TaxID=392227 RepID=UPI0035B66145
MANLLSFFIMTATVIEITIAECNSSNQNPMNIHMEMINKGGDVYKIDFRVRPVAADFQLRIAIVDRDEKKVTLIIERDSYSVNQKKEFWQPFRVNEWTEIKLIITGEYLELETISISTNKIRLMEGTQGPYTASLSHEKLDIYAEHCKGLNFYEKFGGILLSIALALTAIMTFTCLLYCTIWSKKRTQLSTHHRRQSLAETNCQREINREQGPEYCRGDADCRCHIRLQEHCENVGSSTIPKGRRMSYDASEFQARGLDLSREQRQRPGEWKKGAVAVDMPDYERVTWYVE